MPRRRLLLTILGVLAALALIIVVVVNLGGAPTATPGAPSPTPTAGPGQEARSDQPADGEAPGDGSTGLPLPPTEQREPLVTKPLPKSGIAEGELVAGFPSHLLPITPDSAVGISTVATEGDRMQAGVRATTPHTVAEVLAFYERTYATLGLSDGPVNTMTGSTAHAYSRGSDTITVTVTPTASGCEYTLFGAFTAG